MCKILIFGGTTEGRELAEFCAENKLHAYVSVATDYGENLLEASEYLYVLKGRRTAEEMTSFIKNNHIKTVVDATHPYAVEVTKNIKSACENSRTRYIRVKRSSGKFCDSGRYFEDIKPLTDYLNTTEGKILITTGSKELRHFCGVKNFSERCVIRVLPSENIVAECAELGFLTSQIIAEKGPFSEEQNIEQIRKFDARFLVTKESGTLGGFENKVNSAVKCGAELLIIKRPDEQGVTLEEAKHFLTKTLTDKKVTVIGIGMNGFETMTEQAVKAVGKADVLIGAKRMLKPFESLHKPCFESYAADEIARFIFECDSRNIAVLMSGDCGFYSGTERLLPLLDGIETEVLSGISSPVYFCSKLGFSWSDMRFVSLHGRNENIVRNVCMNEKTFFLLGGSVTPKEICRRLCEYDLPHLNVYIGENLACENERISCGKADDFTEAEFDKLCVMIVENRNYEKGVRSCIGDNEFIRGTVPMTKSEVRSVCVSKLEVGKNDICWDIGSGTGSVSVELAMRCCGGTVYSVERKPEAVDLTKQNRRKFGCDNIEIILGNAENIIDSLPAPNCVFIGGSGGSKTLEKIISAAYSKNANVKITVTAVSVETLNSSMEIFDKMGISADITQLAVTRTSKVGTHTMLRAENPVFIIGSVKK